MPSLSATRYAAVVLVVCSLSACVGTAGTTPGGEPKKEREEVNLSQYEDFDPAPYAEEAPAAKEEIEHDVPERLLAGRAAEGIARTVQGYRVQILSSKNKSAAEEAVAQAEQWGRTHAADAPAALMASGGLSVYTVYRQPYYRVRVGNFTSRDAAERALQFLSRRYDDAFIARDQVTVTQ